MSVVFRTTTNYILTGSGASLAPLLAAKPVEQVATERMAGGEIRVVEIVSRIVGHAELFHDTHRPLVGGNREGDELVEPELFECAADNLPCAFGG